MKKVVKYLVAVAVACVAVGMAGQSNSHVADFDRMLLVVAGEQIQSLTVADGDYPTFATQDKYISFEGSKFVARDGEGNELWSAEAPDGERAMLLAKTERYLVATGVPRDKKWLHQEDLPDELWVLDLTDRKTVRTLHAQGLLEKQKGIIVDAIAKNDRIVVLNSIEEPFDWNPGVALKTVGYVLACYQFDKDEPLWTKRIERSREKRVDHVLPLQNRRVNFSHDEVSPLSWIGDDLIVCPDPMEPVQRISIDDGETAWSVDRIWEFRRGYIGATASYHYLGRFGEYSWNQRKFEDYEAFLEERKGFDETYDCSLIAGPAVIEIETPEGQYTESGRMYSIFVVVSKGPKNSGRTEYTSDALLYELNGDGRVISIAALPRFPLGSKFSAIGDSLVWACEDNAAVRVAMSDFRSPKRGRTGVLANIKWFRQFDELDRKAWLTTFPAGDQTAFSAKFLYRPAGGGYVENQGDKQ